LNKAILVNTGAEAVELAIKTARVYNKRSSVIAFHGAFHGKTFGALAVTSRRDYREPFLPLPVGVTHVPFPYCYRCPFAKDYSRCGLFCAKYLEHVLDDPSSGVADVSAVILEPIQGHDGWIVPPPDFLPRLREITGKRNILLIVDEIITGFGRTGAWFAVDHYNVVPDIMVLAKNMAGGFPVSAVVAKDKIMAAWPTALHSSTFLGNPLGCAACLAAIGEIRDRALVDMSRDKGAFLKKLFVKMQQTHPLIGDVRGLGMMVGVELVKNRKTKRAATAETERIVSMAESRGVIVNQGGKFGNVLKMSPPIVITRKQIETAAGIIEDCISAVEKIRRRI